MPPIYEPCLCRICNTEFRPIRVNQVTCSAPECVNANKAYSKKYKRGKACRKSGERPPVDTFKPTKPCSFCGGKIGGDHIKFVGECRRIGLALGKRLPEYVITA